MKKKSRFKVDWRNCKKRGLFTLETRTIGGKKYDNVKVYHFEVCKDCKKDCSGKLQYHAKIGALKALNRTFKL